MHFFIFSTNLFFNPTHRGKEIVYLPVSGGAHSSQWPHVGQVSPGAIEIDLAATGAASATGALAAAAACKKPVNAVMVCATPVDS